MYEVGPLLALENPHVADAFPFAIGTLAQPSARVQSRTAIVARVPADALTWREGTAGRTAALTILARVKDRDGRVVKAGSERYDLERKLGFDDFTDVLFERDVELAPGVYSLEVAAYDEFAARASVRLATMDVRPAAPRGPRWKRVPGAGGAADHESHTSALGPASRQPAPRPQSG